MIDYIKPHLLGFIIVYTYLDHEIIRSDERYIKSILKSQDYSYKTDINIIQTMYKNKPNFISQDIILYTLPHKQASLRCHINLCEIFKYDFKESMLDLLFYSGQSLQIPNIKPSTFNRMKKIIKLLMKDERLSR